MREQYRNMMAGQTLSAKARERFYSALNGKPLRHRRTAVRAAVAAACICLMIPMTVFAADRIFGIGLVEIITGRSKGYRAEFNNVRSYPITAFSEEVRYIEGIRHEAYGSWEEAEQALGIDLMENAFFSENGTYPYRMFNTEWAGEGMKNRLHCYADYFGDSGQLYRAKVTAAYGRDMTYITVSATVTAEHPSISPEDEEAYHAAGRLFGSQYIKAITEEEYTAQSGLTASVIRTEWNTTRAPDYEAFFAVNGISFQICVSRYPLNKEAEAKEMLYEILEGF